MASPYDAAHLVFVTDETSFYEEVLDEGEEECELSKLRAFVDRASPLSCSCACGLVDEALADQVLGIKWSSEAALINDSGMLTFLDRKACESLLREIQASLRTSKALAKRVCAAIKEVRGERMVPQEKRLVQKLIEDVDPDAVPDSDAETLVQLISQHMLALRYAVENNMALGTVVRA